MIAARHILSRNLLALLAMLLAIPAMLIPPGADASETERVVVLVEPGHVQRSVATVVQLGGTILQQFPTLSTFSAEMPRAALSALQSTPGVRAARPDGTLTLSTTTPAANYDATEHHGSLWWLGELTGAHELWRAGHTGAGVDIAMIDSGVVEVPGLNDPSRIIHGPDVSFESVHDDLRHLDTYGHGTHMGGIIAANDGATADPDDPDRIQGLAPDARLISIKAADQAGVADVTQILAAIDWVIANHDRHGLNIRVLNLAFSTDSIQGHLLDPLSYAVEQAWHHGIVVVVAAGNNASDRSLAMPAQNPYVLAVGALDTKDNANPDDDEVAAFSNTGSWARTPDVVAPGTRIVSLRSPGSWLDEQYPAARIGDHMFRGSGTSQSTAVVSGIAALLIHQHPSFSPDQIKHLLTASADRVSGASTREAGNGSVDAADASDTRLPWLPLLYTQLHVPSTGLGTIDGARGTLQISDAGAPLVGEVDIFGADLSVVDWVVDSGLGVAFDDDGVWNGNRWSGGGFEGNRWSGNRWSGNRWSGNRWSGEEWTGNRWSGNRWSGGGWAGNRWSTGDWSGNRWSTSEWN